MKDKKFGLSPRDAFRRVRKAVLEKAGEALLSVIPLAAAVTVMTMTATPVRTDIMISFVFGTLLIALGMGLFSLGAEQSMTPIGNEIGSALTSSRSVPLILSVSFILGLAVTVAEPDLQVLAATVPHINSTVLIITVGVGVGAFLLLSMIRILSGLKLKILLIAFYVIVFVLAALSEKESLAISFDAGGVTTGPMTVPFILALGIGVSRMRSDRSAKADSFGLIALCSIGPILAVLALGFFYKSDGMTSSAVSLISSPDTAGVFKAFVAAFPGYMKETGAALLPIVIIFTVFQIFKLKLSGRDVGKIVIGLVYTYTGLVLFLVGVNVGFSSLGYVIGEQLADDGSKYFLIPVAMAFGWFIISAEPAVIVLEKQVEDVSAGAIPGKAIKYSMSIGVALAMGLSMLRVITGLSVMWFLVPGYLIALVLCFFVPDIYTAIAFDSGGVASGPLTATFMLQFSVGSATALGRNVVTDAFGLVAMVAMMPLISIQLLGLIYGREKKAATEPEVFGDFDIIELWEDAS